MDKVISMITREYFFTFGIGTPMANYYQPIIASRLDEAEEVMRKHWNNNWAAGYSKLEFAHARKEGSFQDLKPLNLLTSIECMRAEDMKLWQERLNNIVNLDGNDKQLRLMALLDDVEIGTDLVKDPFARKLHNTIMDELDSPQIKRERYL